MKKKLFFKLFVLTVMALFYITACQNDDVTVNESGELPQEDYTAILHDLESKVIGVIDEKVNSLTEGLDIDKQNLKSNSSNEDLQKKIIATAIQIEGLNSYKTRVAEEFETFGHTPPPCLGYNLKMNDDNFDKDWYWERGWNFGGDMFKVIAKFNDLIDKINNCLLTAGGNETEIQNLQAQITSLKTTVENYIILINGILDITEGKSELLTGIESEINVIKEDLTKKANKILINGTYKDLQWVYNELIRITNALDERLKTAEDDIDDLQYKVNYIEQTELPEIWTGLEILHKYIGDVYSTLDHRISSLTFKPDFDFGPGLSSLILVKGLSAWESKTVKDGFGWQQDTDGSVYKAFTYLKYDVSPSNVTLDDFEVVDLLYQTTTMVTRSNSEPLLKIVNDEIRYPITLDEGVLSVPVLINKDIAPMSTTSFDENAKNNIKVALRIKNLTEPEDHPLPDEPEHGPQRPEEPESRSVKVGSESEDDRYVVSSEYVTVWMGLFDGRIAVVEKMEDSNNNEPVDNEDTPLYPYEIVTADFLNKTVDTYPSVTLLVTNDQNQNSIDIAEWVSPVYKDEFEKKYTVMENKDFEKDFILTYELADLGNDHTDFISLDGSILKVSDKQKAIGETVAVLVKAKVDETVHAVGYVRVLVVGEDKELITISDKLTLGNATIDCAEPFEFSITGTVQTFVTNKILNNAAVNGKTKIIDADVFYQKYTGDIEINSVQVINAYATLPQLSDEVLKNLFTFEYVPGDGYIKGTISNEAPIGTYTIETTLSSEERIPDIKITWVFTVNTPKLIWEGSQDGILKIDPTHPNLSRTNDTSRALYSASISDLFKKHSDGGFEYEYIESQVCADFVSPYFVFANVPNGYDISSDGTKVEKNGIEVAVIELIDIIDEGTGEVIGNYYGIRLIANEEVAGLVGNDNIRIAGKGTINGGTHTIYEPFKVSFTNALVMVFPENAKFSASNIFSLNLYKNNNDIVNVVRDLIGNELTVYDQLESKRFIDHYGIDLDFDTSMSVKTSLPTQQTIYSPYIFDLENARFNKTVTGLSISIMDMRTVDVRSYYGDHTPIRYRFKLENNSTSPLPEDLTVTIPVILKHRWGTTIKELIIKIN